MTRIARPSSYSFLVVCPGGIEDLLKAELLELGIGAAQIERQGRGALTLSAPLSMGYRIAFASQLASNVLVELGRARVRHGDELYRWLATLPWHEHMRVDQSFAFDVATSKGQQWIARRFAMQRAKDALVDAFRARSGRRPNVDREAPDLRFHLYVGNEEAALSVVLANRGLHRRGHQREHAAPIKESLAAAVLRFAGWHERALDGPRWLLDPMCGSGTLLVEAVAMATDLAPGLRRGDRRPHGWLHHDAAAWEAMHGDFSRRHDLGRSKAPHLRLFAADRSAAAVEEACDNLHDLGLELDVSSAVMDVATLHAPAGGTGLLVTNPPYGERVLETSEALMLHETLGDVMRRNFLGWQAAVLSKRELLPCIGLKPERKHPVLNGALECAVGLYRISPVAPAGTGPRWKRRGAKAEMLANRLKKSVKALRPWAEQQQTDCYRIYEADIPEFPAVIDRFGSALVIYDRPRSQERPEQTLERLRDLHTILGELFPDLDVVVKARQSTSTEERSHGSELRHDRREAREGGLRFWINVEDYLDCGIFPDERRLRRRIAKEARDQEFLNLFSYTCAASVYAAAAGAKRCVSVDLSTTYLDWGRDNFELNDLDLDRHRFVRDDCLSYCRRSARSRFDVIYLGPPIESVSKRADRFSLHKDGQELLRQAVALLRPSGSLYFSSPVPDVDPERWLPSHQVTEITRETTSRDYAKSKLPRRSWQVRHR